MFQPVKRSYKCEGKHRLRLRFRRGTAEQHGSSRKNAQMCGQWNKVCQTSQFLDRAIGQGSTV